MQNAVDDAFDRCGKTGHLAKASNYKASCEPIIPSLD